MGEVNIFSLLSGFYSLKSPHFSYTGIFLQGFFPLLNISLNAELTSGSCGCTVISFSKLNFLSYTHLCSCLSSIWKLSRDLLTCQLLPLLVTCTQNHQSPSEGPFTSVRSSPSTRSTWIKNYEKIRNSKPKDGFTCNCVTSFHALCIASILVFYYFKVGGRVHPICETCRNGVKRDMILCICQRTNEETQNVQLLILEIIMQIANPKKWNEIYVNKTHWPLVRFLRKWSFRCHWHNTKA